MLTMKGNARRYIDIAQSVSVGHKEGVFIVHVGSNLFQPSSRAGLIAGVNKGDFPWLCDALMNLHSIRLHVECHVRHMQEIVRKVFLDHVALVSATNNEVVDPMVGIQLQDMPQNRAAADLNHRFGADGSLLTEARSKSAG